MRNVLLLSSALTALAGASEAQPISGLYIGAGGGANFMQQLQVRSTVNGGAPAYGRAGFETGWVGLGSVGYALGNGLRLEAEGNYRRNDYGSGLSGRETKYGGMVNALFDLDVGSPYVYPYIGGGVGYQRVDQRLTVAPGARISADDNAFAYQAIAGLSFPIPPVVGLSLTAEYRYFALPGDQTFTTRVGASTAQSKVRGDVDHSLMLGLRYAFNVVPPPPPAAAAPAGAPAPAPNRTYLVFFDWDRADLTPRARQIVAEAATASTRVQVTQIEVNGYTDTSGTPRYNEGLSLRRAQNVAAELARDGVPKQAIAIRGYGETRLLVPTAQGVREPQNRRVEIILK